MAARPFAIHFRDQHMVRMLRFIHHTQPGTLDFWTCELAMF